MSKYPNSRSAVECALRVSSIGSMGLLATPPYLAGESYSIADISAMVVVDFARWIKLEVPESAVNLARWYDSVSQRPSAKV